MKTIWKFELIAEESQTILIPDGGEILTAQFQGDTLCLWALVEPGATSVERFIQVYGTGHAVDFDIGFSRKYIATAQMPRAPLVWHVFEREEPITTPAINT